MTLVLAIPIGAVFATAKPIPGPPSRKILNFFPQPDTTTDEAEEQQQSDAEKEKEKQRTDKKRRADRESSSDSKVDEGQSSAPKQRAS